MSVLSEPALDLVDQEEPVRVGATRDTARLRSRLRQVRVRRCNWYRPERPASGWPSLTETERRVANVAAEGLTNAPAGDRLILPRGTRAAHAVAQLA